MNFNIQQRELSLCLFRAGAGTGNIDHAQQAEHQRLNKTGEQVKIDGQHRGDTEGQHRHTGQDIQRLQQAKEAQHKTDRSQDLEQ